MSVLVVVHPQCISVLLTASCQPMRLHFTVSYCCRLFVMFLVAIQGLYCRLLACRNSIDYIYKQLTRSSVHPLGGQAYLSLEVDDEPYLGGVKYTAMPPTKRFRDMEQLSGT